MNCHCHCNGKCHLLGGLEQEIMEVLWQSSNPLTPRQVLQSLSRHCAYTTVMTVLRRLATKKIVRRRPSGRSFSYSPAKNKSDFARDCLTDLFHRLFHSYGQTTVDCFFATAKKTGIKLSS